MKYTLIKTPVAKVFVAYRDDTLCLLSAHKKDAFVTAVEYRFQTTPKRDTNPPKLLLRQIAAAIVGAAPYPGEVDLAGLTPFQRKVLRVTARIPRGEVRTYAWVARKTGHLGAHRATGTALAVNPVPFVIPCHRVIRSDGGIGAYSGGAPGIKETLLRYEGVRFSDADIVSYNVPCCPFAYP